MISYNEFFWQQVESKSKSFVSGAIGDGIGEIIPSVEGNKVTSGAQSVFPILSDLNSVAQKNSKTMTIDNLLVYSQELDSHFVVNGGFVVTQDKRVISLVVQSEEDIEADKRATADFDEFCKRTGEEKTESNRQEWLRLKSYYYLDEDPQTVKYDENWKIEQDPTAHIILKK